MRIFKYKDKLVEEVSYTKGDKVVFFKYVKEEDKDECPHCHKKIEIVHDIVENCLNWQTDVKEVDTVNLRSKAAINNLLTLKEVNI